MADPTSSWQTDGDATEPHSLESLGRGSGLALLGQVFFVAALFGSRVLLVRNLSGAAFGTFALGLALTNLLIAIVGMGMPSGVARQLAHDASERKRRSFESASLLITVPVAGATALALFFGAPALADWLGDPLLSQAFPFFAVYLVAATFLNLVPAFFQGREDLLPNALFNQILNPVLGLGFLVLFVSGMRVRLPFIASVGFGPIALPGTDGLGGALFAYTLGAVGALAALVVYAGLRRRAGEAAVQQSAVEIRAPPLKVSAFRGARSLLRFSLPLSLVLLASIAPGSIDTVVLGRFESSVVVGMYNAVLPLARLVLLGSVSLSAIMLPVSTRLLRGGDAEELRRSYATSTKWIVLASLPFFVLFFAFPVSSLDLVYGSAAAAPAYASAALVLRVMSLGTFLLTILGPATSVLIGLGRLRLVMINMGLGAAIDLVGSLVLVPPYGAVGAAVAFSAAVLTPAVLSVAQTRSLVRVDPFRWTLAKPLLAVLAPTAVVFTLSEALWRWSPTPMYLVALFFVVLVLYLGAIVLTGSLEPEDTHLLGVLEKRLGRPMRTLRRIARRFLPELQVGSAAVESGPPVG
jgi:O-antigen/teichoic acid export membrane protein